MLKKSKKKVILDMKFSVKLKSVFNKNWQNLLKKLWILNNTLVH